MKASLPPRIEQAKESPIEKEGQAEFLRSLTIETSEAERLAMRDEVVRQNSVLAAKGMLL